MKVKRWWDLIICKKLQHSDQESFCRAKRINGGGRTTCEMVTSQVYLLKKEKISRRNPRLWGSWEGYFFEKDNSRLINKNFFWESPTLTQWIWTQVLIKVYSGLTDIIRHFESTVLVQAVRGVETVPENSHSDFKTDIFSECFSTPKKGLRTH